MKIEKYRKLKSGKYEVILENYTKYELYEEVILKYNLLLLKKIEEKKKKEILAFNQEIEVYYMALNYLKKSMKSKQEIKDYLRKKQYKDEYIDLAIFKLEKQGYINDLVYARSFLNNKLITTSNGPLKIRYELLKKNIKEEIIDSVLEEYHEEIQKEKIEKNLIKAVKANRTRGNTLLKRKIMNDLITQGFNKSLINEAIDHYPFESDQEIVKKEYNKLYKRLSTKYSGKELELKIRQKMAQKGMYYEE